MPQNYADIPDFLKDFLEGQGSDLGLRANFFARPEVQGLGGGVNRQRYASNQYQPYLDKYLGALGGQALQGQGPTLSWTDFLTQNLRNFQQDYLRAPVGQTGRQTSQLAGPARYLYGF